MTLWSLPSEVAAKTCAEKGEDEEPESEVGTGATATAEALRGAPSGTAAVTLEAVSEVPRELARSKLERRRVQGSCVGGVCEKRKRLRKGREKTERRRKKKFGLD